MVNTLKNVLVVEYDPAWPRVFEALRSSLWRALSDVAISIEHVGSTSVPGLSAKPVIDLDVIAPPGEIRSCIARLAALGYEHQGDLGIPDREAFHRPPGSPPHHLYLCSPNSQGLANHLAIRNYLRANASAAKAYGDLKARLAREYPTDIDAYTQSKTDFLLSILRKAGFPTDALAEIEHLNR